MSKRFTVAELKILVDGLEYRVSRLEQQPNKHPVLKQMTGKFRELVQSSIAKINACFHQITTD